MTQREKIEKLKKIWSDKYFCKLAILDHLRECVQKDDHLKANDLPKGGIAYQNLDKELMDLKILLDLYFQDSEKLLSGRLDRFLENAENETGK